ncbi:MAG: cellobiose phosphorylase, partial [Oscillospiraceae bacterium]|nr:cellobiose phosphorylase [Oscillospiraceae bacterium]
MREAEALKPRLHITQKALPGSDRALKAGDEVLFDFGDHYTGYVTVEFAGVGRHQDAPLFFSIRFFESAEEFKEKPERYHGWISPA